MHVHDILAAATLERDASTPLFRQLYAHMKAAILDGRIGAGVRLPATRTLCTCWTSRARPCWPRTSN